MMVLYLLEVDFKLSEDGDVKDDISLIGCMHIDTEGWECHVLKGMQSILNDINNKGM
jgi:hypothetical protein